MMSCDAFRSSFRAGTENAALLAHLRTCDRCLDFAAGVDPDVMFRALGGEDLIPPGGVDSFVDDVMRQVRVRGAENTAATKPRAAAWPQRLAIAATLTAALMGTMLVTRYDTAEAPMPVARAKPRAAAIQQVALVNKPIIEDYQSDNATIVEVPTESNDDVKIVMIFDENLPADL